MPTDDENYIIEQFTLIDNDFESLANLLTDAFLHDEAAEKDGGTIIFDAETSGELSPGQTVVELTSGNTGTGLAIVCGIKGYPFVAVMSKGNSVERARMMSALGAEVVLVDQLPESIPGHVSGGDLELVEQETRKIAKARKAFRADQFNLMSILDNI